MLSGSRFFCNTVPAHVVTPERALALIRGLAQRFALIRCKIADKARSGPFRDDNVEMSGEIRPDSNGLDPAMTVVQREPWFSAARPRLRRWRKPISTPAA